jgi:hypothetical protein
VQQLMIMDQGWCASAIAFRTRGGNSDGIALGGRTVVFAVDFPGPTLFDGNATGSRWTDPDLRQFTTKSGARGAFSWSG